MLQDRGLGGSQDSTENRGAQPSPGGFPTLSDDYWSGMWTLCPQLITRSTSRLLMAIAVASVLFAFNTQTLILRCFSDYQDGDGSLTLRGLDLLDMRYPSSGKVVGGYKAWRRIGPHRCMRVAVKR